MSSLQEKFDEIFELKSMKIDYPDDCNMIIDVIKKELDVVLKPFQAQKIWRWYSDEFFCAGWLQLVSEDEILKAFHSWMQENDPEYSHPKWTLGGVDESDI